MVLCRVFRAKFRLPHDPAGSLEFNFGVGPAAGFGADAVLKLQSLGENDGICFDSLLFPVERYCCNFNWGREFYDCAVTAQPAEENIELCCFRVEVLENHDAGFGIVFALEYVSGDTQSVHEERVVVNFFDFLIDERVDSSPGLDNLACAGVQDDFRGEHLILAGIVGDGVGKIPEKLRGTLAWHSDQDRLGCGVINVKRPGFLAIICLGRSRCGARNPDRDDKSHHQYCQKIPFYAVSHNFFSTQLSSQGLDVSISAFSSGPFAINPPNSNNLATDITSNMRKHITLLIYRQLNPKSRRIVTKRWQFRRMLSTRGAVDCIIPAMCVIGPVPKWSRRKALRHVLAGTIPDAQVNSRAAGLAMLFRRGEKLNSLWWVRDGRKIVGTAFVLGSAGRVGFLYHSLETTPGVDKGALSELLRKLSRHVLSEGFSMVQTLIEPEFRRHVSALKSAGFEELAELVYSKRDLAEISPPEEPGPWEFHPGGTDSARPELIETIRQTYQGTLDCPKLAGVRKMEDVIASHMTTGLFTPRWWWLVRRDNKNAGCILMNRSLYSRSAEISYMGVVPEFRRQGLGWRMLSHAANEARQAGLGSLLLVEDAANTSAGKLYDKFGFVETHRKISYALLKNE